MNSSIERPACSFLVQTTPLFKEKWHTSTSALVTNREHPLTLHGASTSSTLPADNHPVNASKAETPQILQEWFDG
jgi:hypothetical protein